MFSIATVVSLMAMSGGGADLTKAVETNLAQVPERRAEWEKVIADAKGEEKEGLEYLVAYMPLGDLKSYSSERLVENTKMAYDALSQVPWGKSLPKDVVLDSVLPYANVTEPRHPWRKEFMDKYLPLVKSIKTPGEAALVMNATLFRDYHVGYNTKRLRTDQSPDETIAQGMATCTGLSIMLVDACRAVGIPARVAGINSWPGRGGNHTWVEVWDNGWHFVGAAEPDPAGLDHGWFKGEAAGAVKDKPDNAIWAVTYKKTGAEFPLAWDPGAGVNAENVTDRYKNTAPVEGPRLMVEVKKGDTRVVADVTVVNTQTGLTVLHDKSFGPDIDINRHVSTVTGDGEFVVIVRYEGTTAVTWAEKSGSGDTVVNVDMNKPGAVHGTWFTELLTNRFGTDEGKARIAGEVLKSLPVSSEEESAAWEAFKSSPARAELKKEWEAKTVKTVDRQSPYLWRYVGEKPKSGKWPLVIAMHGGGNTTQEFNDSQWHSMFDSYYKDHPEAGGYIYLALRAPNNTWNGFYDDAICPLVERMIEQFVVFADADPDMVFATGASHGGYGAFVIGPKIPYRFARVNASASAPTPGETEGVNLRNLPFTWTIGEQDTAYGRADRCKEFADQWAKWKAEYGGFEGGMRMLPNTGHSVPDRELTAEFMKSAPRNLWPKRVIWKQTDTVLKRFYWLEIDSPKEGGSVDATVDGNTISLTLGGGLEEAALWLSPKLVDFSKPVSVSVNGGPAKLVSTVGTMATYCDGVEKTGDPEMATGVRVVVSIPK